MRIRWALLAGAAAVGGGVLMLPTASANILSRLTEPAFYIPNESSLLSFRVLRPNPGSGDWWLYGEDRERHYAISDHDHWSYHVIEKSRLPPGFDPLDKATWGAAARLGRAR